jgi:MerR family transcriptional regulator/heat shock protein HspR
MAKERKQKYTISVVAEEYGVHPQTLRLYEREGLSRPQISGATLLHRRGRRTSRIDAQPDSRSGINLAGVEIILNMH